MLPIYLMLILRTVTGIDVVNVEHLRPSRLLGRLSVIQRPSDSAPKQVLLERLTGESTILPPDVELLANDDAGTITIRANDESAKQLARHVIKMFDVPMRKVKLELEVSVPIERYERKANLELTNGFGYEFSEDAIGHSFRVTPRLNDDQSVTLTLLEMVSEHRSVATMRIEPGSTVYVGLSSDGYELGVPTRYFGDKKPNGPFLSIHVPKQ